MSLSRVIAKRLAALAIVGGTVVASSVSWAQETIRTRGWTHEEFGRLVFDWTKPVDYQAMLEDGTLVMRFDQAMESDFSRALGRLEGYLASAELSENGQVVRFRLKQPVALNSFRNGNAVVVDLRPRRETQQDTKPTSALNLPIRVGLHPKYTRFVFDWAIPVDYDVEEDGRELTIRFDKAAVVNTQDLARDLPEGYSNPRFNAEEGRSALSLRLPADRRVRHFKTGPKVVLDVLPDQDKQQASTDAETEQQNASRATDAGPTPPAIPDEPTDEEKTVEEREQKERETEAAEALASLQPPNDEAEEPEPEQRAVAQNQDTAKTEPEQDGTDDTLEDSPSDPQTDERGAVEADQTAEEAQETIAPDVEAMASNLPVGEETQVDMEGPAPVSLVFQWPEEVGAAAFRRGNNVWIMFDRRAPIDLVPLREQGEPLIERIEQLDVAGSTVLRMRTMPGVNPFAKREGYDWVFDFRKAPIAPRHQVMIQARADATVGPQLLFPVAEPGTIINLFDPDVGDTLRIATYKDPGYGVAGKREYPEFAILPSAQGLVVQSISDAVLFDRDLNGFELSSPEGLHISAVSPEAPVSTGARLSSKRLFDFDSWAQGGAADYYAAEQRLFRAVTEVPTEKKTDARLDLARFYAARGRGAEAIGVIRTVEADDPDAATRPDFRALRGVSHFLNREYEKARRDFDDPRLDGFSEIAIWRGATLAELDEWDDAARQFRGGDSLLRDYPYPLKGRLSLLRIGAALATQDLQSADAWMATLDMRPDELRRGQLAALRYNQARVALTKKDVEGAREIWERLVNGDDWRMAVRAEYALINLGLKEDTITIDEAVERLEKLRFKWRGDSFELGILRRLGELHVQANDYMSGLGIMRTAVTYFPNRPEAQKLAERMVETFRSLYLDGKADELPPLRALAIYDEFRELTPSGADGDRMVELLADRLIAVDLLNRAITLLDHQVKFRLTGEEKARVGAKLALVQLLDGLPQDAISTLKQTNFPQLPRGLQDDRRRLLAKAYFETGNKEEAIKLLAGDISQEADMLRRDIYWSDEDWAEVAKVLQRLAGDPPEDPVVGVPDDKARYVLNWAVALRLNNDEDGLALLNELYGEAMQYSSLASTYRFVATPVESGFSTKLQDTIQQLADSDLFNAFMNNYRGKLLNEPEASAGQS